MEDQYWKENILQKTDHHDVNYFKNRYFSKQPHSSTYLKEFSYDEKAEIFNDVYSCINKFYLLLDDSPNKARLL